MIITMENSIKIAKERIKQAFSHYQKLGLAWSGGKDSTTLLVLTLEALKESKGELHVVHNDTLIENPIIRAHCDRVLQELKNYIQKENLPVHIYIATPQPT
ncbi:MAG: phosphoadenosine phosphosulfate reductase family protein, partial [Candidatus Aenigmatarchaeota archaeon]